MPFWNVGKLHCNVKPLLKNRPSFTLTSLGWLAGDFFDGFGKIGLFLGSGFVSKENNPTPLADFDHDTKDMFEEKRFISFKTSMKRMMSPLPKPSNKPENEESR